MSAIQSTTPVGAALLHIPMHIDPRANLIVDGIDDALSIVISAARDALRAIDAPLEKYFDNLGEKIKNNMNSIISGIKKINWEDAKSIMNGLRPILGFLQPVFKHITKNPSILIPVIKIFLAILGFGVSGVPSMYQ